jgi:MarR family transcriptional regulator, organic hydroperoxide resistance regulator
MQKSEEQMQGVLDNLRRIHQAIGEYTRMAEKETELTGPQLWALQLLAISPLRVSDLARQMFLRPATIVGIVDRLEMKGLISRTRSTDDRRVVDVALTGKGEEVVAKAPKVVQLLLLNGLATLPDDEFTAVVEGMKLMVRLLRAEHHIPRPLHT